MHGPMSGDLHFVSIGCRTLLWMLISLAILVEVSFATIPVRSSRPLDHQAPPHIAPPPGIMSRRSNDSILLPQTYVHPAYLFSKIRMPSAQRDPDLTIPMGNPKIRGPIVGPKDYTLYLRIDHRPFGLAGSQPFF